MDFCFITFRSVTPAQRAERLLRHSGVACHVRRTPRWMEAQGCGYGLQVRFFDAQACVRLLNKAEVPYRKVYLLGQNGAAEELSL